MKDIITTYCKKTIKFTNESTKNTEATLRNLTENYEFDKILKTNVELPNVSWYNGNSKSSTI